MFTAIELTEKINRHFEEELDIPLTEYPVEAPPSPPPPLDPPLAKPEQPSCTMT